jgi:hypothetical protein
MHRGPRPVLSIGNHAQSVALSQADMPSNSVTLSEGLDISSQVRLLEESPQPSQSSGFSRTGYAELESINPLPILTAEDVANETNVLYHQIVQKLEKKVHNQKESKEAVLSPRELLEEAKPGFYRESQPEKEIVSDQVIQYYESKEALCERAREILKQKMERQNGNPVSVHARRRRAIDKIQAQKALLNFSLETVLYAKNMFDLLDPQGSGHVSPAQLAKALRSLNISVPVSVFDKLLEVLAVRALDGNIALGFPEFLLACCNDSLSDAHFDRIADLRSQARLQKQRASVYSEAHLQSQQLEAALWHRRVQAGLSDGLNDLARDIVASKRFGGHTQKTLSPDCRALDTSDDAQERIAAAFRSAHQESFQVTHAGLQELAGVKKVEKVIKHSRYFVSPRAMKAREAALHSVHHDPRAFVGLHLHPHAPSRPHPGLLPSSPNLAAQPRQTSPGATAHAGLNLAGRTGVGGNETPPYNPSAINPDNPPSSKPGADGRAAHPEIGPACKPAHNSQNTLFAYSSPWEAFTADAPHPLPELQIDPAELATLYSELHRSGTEQVNARDPFPLSDWQQGQAHPVPLFSLPLGLWMPAVARTATINSMMDPPPPKPGQPAYKSSKKLDNALSAQTLHKLWEDTKQVAAKKGAMLAEANKPVFPELALELKKKYPTLVQKIVDRKAKESAVYTMRQDDEAGGTNPKTFVVDDLVHVRLDHHGAALAALRFVD